MRSVLYVQTSGRLRARGVLVTSCLLLGLALLPGCVIVKTGSEKQREAAATAASDPKARAEAIWAPKLLPYAMGKAAPWTALHAQAASDPAAAIKAHGYRAGSDGRPVLFATIDGTVTAVDTASRAGRIEVDTDGDGKADVAVQIGPVIRGSAVRDGLDFTPFSSFSNQIDYADFSKALNNHVRDVVLGDVKRDALRGRRVHVLGAFFFDAAQPLPLVTPIVFTVPSPAAP